MFGSEAAAMGTRTWLYLASLAFTLVIIRRYAVELTQVQTQLNAAETELGKVQSQGRVHALSMVAHDESGALRLLQNAFVETPYDGAQCLQWTEQVASHWSLLSFSAGHCEQPTEDCIQTVGYPDTYTSSATCGIQFAASTTSGLILQPESFFIEDGVAFLAVNGEQYTGSTIFKPFEVSIKTTIEFSSEASDPQGSDGGWKFCLRSSCANYTCPAGYERDPNAEYLACANLTCTEDDLHTCCVSLATAACTAPTTETLRTEHEVPSGCVEGNTYTFVSGTCQMDCAAGYALNGFGTFQACDELTQNFTVPDCQQVLSDAGGSFRWQVTASSVSDCYEYGPSCVASVGFQSGGYSASRRCTVNPTSVYWPLTDYRLYVTYLSTEEIHDKLILVDYYSLPYFTYYQESTEFAGQGLSLGPYNIGRVEWSSDVSINDRGWLVCAQAKCETMTCPLGYIFNCDAKDDYCTGTCDTWSDVAICCKNETSEELAGILELGQARNSTTALCFTTTTTTPHSYQLPSWTGEMQVVAVDDADVDGLEQALRQGFASLSNVSSLRVWIWLVGPGLNNTFQVGWIVEQTEIDLATIPDQMLLDAFNEHGGASGRRLNANMNASVGWVEDILSRTTVERPAADREQNDGYHAFPGYCKDEHPCNRRVCWRDTTTTQKTCGQLHAEAFCANPPDIFNGGPGFDDFVAETGWSTGFNDWISNSYDPSFSSFNSANQACCTCGGGSCSAGSYLMTQSGGSTSNIFCAPCPAGTSSENGETCAACPAGRYSGAGASVCEACGSGHYAAEEGMSTCIACGPGFVVTSGRRGCEMCLPGTAPESGSCVRCTRGRFSAQNASSSCEVCPAGRAIDTRGQTACEACAPGRALMGSTNSNAMRECQDCSTGRFALASEQSECDQCSPGSVQSQTGQTQCEDCDIGYFQSKPGLEECEICAGGWDAADIGSSACDRCERGSYKPDGEINCTFCEPGRFTPSEGQADCDSCVTGTASAEFGASACGRCVPGRYADVQQMLACLACDPGQFQPNEEAENCDRCDAGYFTNASGMSTCSMCEPGHFTAVGGLAFCTACAPGEEASAAGSTDCQICRAGQVSPSAGTPECKSCAPGTYSPVEGFSACRICQVGRYAGVEGLSECPRCAYGSYAEEEGMTRCIGCNESFPGVAESWTTWEAPTEAEQANGRKAWYELLGADNRSACGCRADWQPVGDICEPCGEGLICLGNGELDIVKGYAWDGEYSVWDCSLGVEEACPGGHPGTCMPGRNTEGIACAECWEGMVPYSDGSCLECENADYMVPTLVLLGGIICAIITYCLYDSAKRKRPKLSIILIVASLGQFVTVIQQLGIISLIRVEWSGPLKQVLENIQSVTFFDVQVLRPSCVVVMDIVRLYALRVGLVFICLVIVVLAHLASQLLQHRHDWRTRFPSLACAVGTILLTFFVSIVSTMLGPLQCKRHPNGRLTISWYPSIPCWEGGKHHSMIIIGSVACILPVVFLSACVWAVRTYPRKLLKPTSRFLNAWAFLFFRYTAKAYWYGPIVLVRNGLIAAGPVLVSPIAQIVLLEMTMLLSLCLLLRVMPWRLEKANYLDAAGHLCLLMVTMMASFFVEGDSTGFISILSVVFILFISLVLVLCVIHGIVMFIRSRRRPFQFFLCHHKLGAGCFCRLLKFRLLVSPGVERKVFIDSDDLTNLDTLFDSVAHETETLVAIFSQSLLLRPWCVGELTTAFRNQVIIQPVYVSGVDVLQTEFIENFMTYMQDISCLTQFGIDLPMIQEAFRFIQTLPAIFLQRELHDDILISLCSKLVRRSVTDQMIEAKTGKASEGANVIIIADTADLEATSTSFILQDLLNPVIQHMENSIASVLPLGSRIPEGTQMGLLVCTNGVFTQHVISALVDCLSCSAAVFPVMSVTNFIFPSEVWMLGQKQFQDLEPSTMNRAMAVITAVFTEIAVDFQPSALSGTEAALTLKAGEIAARMFGVARISEKVDTLAQKKRVRDSSTQVVIEAESSKKEVTVSIEADSSKEEIACLFHPETASMELMQVQANAIVDRLKKPRNKGSRASSPSSPVSRSRADVSSKLEIPDEIEMVAAASEECYVSRL